jgi:hypothetical protein
MISDPLQHDEARGATEGLLSYLQIIAMPHGISKTNTCAVKNWRIWATVKAQT